MNQFESGGIVAIADVPENLVGKVVQGQPVTIVQIFIGNDAEVLVAGLNRKEYPIAVGNLCGLLDGCKARAARWFLCDIPTHKESLAAYKSVVEQASLDGLTVWHMFEHFDVRFLRFMMQDMVAPLFQPYSILT